MFLAFAPSRPGESLWSRRGGLPASWSYTTRPSPAEIELRALNRQCLNRRIADQTTMQRVVGGWRQDRNAAGMTVDWRFTTVDARIKLKRLYPKI